MLRCDRPSAEKDNEVKWCKIDREMEIRSLYRLRHGVEVSNRDYDELIGDMSLNSVLTALGFALVDQNGQVKSQAEVNAFLMEEQRSGRYYKVIKSGALYSGPQENRICIVMSSLLPQRLQAEEWFVSAVLDKEEDKRMLLLLQRKEQLKPFLMIDERIFTENMPIMQQIAAGKNVALSITGMQNIHRQGFKLHCFEMEEVVFDFMGYLYCIKDKVDVVKAVAYQLAQMLLRMFDANITHGNLLMKSLFVRYQDIDGKQEAVLNCADWTYGSCTVPYPELDATSLLLNMQSDPDLQSDAPGIYPIFLSAMNEMLKQIRGPEYRPLEVSTLRLAALRQKYEPFMGKVRDTDLEHVKHVKILAPSENPSMNPSINPRLSRKPRRSQYTHEIRPGSQKTSRKSSRKSPRPSRTSPSPRSPRVIPAGIQVTRGFDY